ncbi:uncharacterized protein LOC143209460 [Lasioglossum baleicum]|uniref:uncharacterized protein LOC143209460 n=1 Tax=Lasioglossum baleicum TaxID=434251 RepID=UPI003FCD9DD0
MSTTQITNAADIICGLKAAVTALECYHNMDILRQTQELKRQKPTPPPMFMMIPIEEKDDQHKKSRTDKHNHKHKKSIENVPTIKPHSHTHHTNPNPKDDCSHLLLDSKFPEMRGGILYTRCYCVHRDGLQNSCPLTSCQDHPDCGGKPWPTCPPANYIRCRYPQQFPTKNNNFK